MKIVKSKVELVYRVRLVVDQVRTSQSIFKYFESNDVLMLSLRMRFS